MSNEQRGMGVPGPSVHRQRNGSVKENIRTVQPSPEGLRARHRVQPTPFRELSRELLQAVLAIGRDERAIAGRMFTHAEVRVDRAVVEQLVQAGLVLGIGNVGGNVKTRSYCLKPVTIVMIQEHLRGSTDG